MIQKKHNEASRQFMQRILIFIDSVLLNSVNSESQDVNKTLLSGVLNIRDALFSEIIRDNHLNVLNDFLNEEKNPKKNESDLSQEAELDKNQEK